MASYSKEEARSIIQYRLDLLPPGKFEASATAVRTHVSQALTELAGSRRLSRVLSYHASAKWLEIDLTLLEKEFADATFDYVPLDTDAPMPSAPYDVILVPLYGFNSDGYRLGHGKGWYDRFLLSKLGALKVGVGLEASCIDFATEPFDIPMDVICTEKRHSAVQVH